MGEVTGASTRYCIDERRRQINKSGKFRYIEAGNATEFKQAADLFLEYADSLGFSLEFQDFDRELADIPGDYAAPDGCILLAYSDEIPVGCVALRKLDTDVCEMKRLYVKPEFRYMGIGKTLSEKIVEKARSTGYGKMRLDTVASMTEAISIYRSMGFRVIEPYRFNPFNDAVFMEMTL